MNNKTTITYYLLLPQRASEAAASRSNCCRSERALSERARQQTKIVQLFKILILLRIIFNQHALRLYHNATRGYINELHSSTTRPLTTRHVHVDGQGLVFIYASIFRCLFMLHISLYCVYSSFMLQYFVYFNIVNQ